MEHDLQNILLVSLSPCSYWQLCDLQGGGAEASYVAIDHVLRRLCVGYGTSKVLVPRLLGEINKERMDNNTIMSTR